MTIEVWKRGIDAIKLVVGDKSIDIGMDELPALIEELQFVSEVPISRQWNDVDTQRLKNLMRQGYKPKEIARELNRDIKAVHNKLYTIRKEA